MLVQLKSKGIKDPELLAKWQKRAGDHPYAIGAVDYSEDWGTEEKVTYTDIIRWVKTSGPIYVYQKDSNLLMEYYF